ncbi:MAG: hypothetical protein QOE90_692 [Thermoplasmata archaeon]|jgi:hypothetical protein|nr:hypothetical protein [Thermoplasmata archaeon]
MVNKRMIAVAAVLLLAVPAMGAAGTLYLGPQPEQLVEGHTVFTVIENVGNNTTVTNQAQFAAAVAVLVRENTASNVQLNQRFPGVLWFNDQYLVNPTNSTQDAASGHYRYPCGGAVLAVNQGDPDPRVVITNSAAASSTPVGGMISDPGNPYAWIGSAPDSSTVLGATVGSDYKASYLITDPNDHAWIIDKYQFYTTDSPGTLQTKTYNYPVWVVNIGGGAVFLPDDGVVNCSPYVDSLDNAYNTAVGNAPPGPYPDQPSTLYYNEDCAINHGVTDVPLNSINNPQADQPCAGAYEPTNAADNGGASYCYDGNAYAGGSCQDKTLYPVRQYNALLYFNLQDLYVNGAPIQHGTANADTNGCQTGTEWACPNGDDNAEGNSHPFNPNYGTGTGTGTSYTTDGNSHNSASNPGSQAWTSQACPAWAGSPSTLNHGGSDGAVWNSTAGAYDDPSGCNMAHATKEISLYFDGKGRPFPPVNRCFSASCGGVQDTEGSSAPFAGLGNGSAAPPVAPSPP